LPKYCLALVTDPKYWSGSKNLVIINKSIIEHNYFLLKKKFNIKLCLRLNKKNQNKYVQKVDFFVKKKFLIYKKQIIKILNKYNTINENEKYWDKIISSWLFDVITVVKFRFDDLLFVKKNKNFYILYINKNNFNFLNFSFDFFTKSANSSRLNQFIYNQIADILKINKKLDNNKLKIIDSKEQIAKNKNNFFNTVIFYFYNLYVWFLNPVILVDSYFNIKDSLKIFFLSKGKILFVSSYNFFKNFSNNKINKNLRDTIKIKQNDLFDKAFNSLVGFLLPTSFLENFYETKINIKNYSKNIKLIGSAVCFLSNDNYKILTAEMLKYKKKPVIFAHGHSDGLMRHDSKFEFELNHIHKHITYSNKDGLGISNLRRLNTIKIEDHNEFVSLFLTKVDQYFFKTNIFPIRTNSYLEVLKENFQFYKSLTKNIKVKFILRPHLLTWSKEKKIWFKKFGKNLNTDCSINNKQIFNKSKIIVMGYISVTTFESLYLDKPTIIFCNIEDYFFKKNHLFFFKMLVDAKIIHKNSYEAANFINKNYSNVENWWQSDKVRKVIKTFKEKYCVDNCRFADSLIKNLS